MGQIYITELSRHVGEEVTLKGWLYKMRSSGKLLFPQLRDGTGIVQCVVAKNSVTPEVWEALKPLGQESSLVVTGSVREDNRAPGERGRRRLNPRGRRISPRPCASRGPAVDVRRTRYSRSAIYLS